MTAERRRRANRASAPMPRPAAMPVGRTPPVRGSGRRLAEAGRFGMESGPIFGPVVLTVAGEPFAGLMIAEFPRTPVALSATFTTTAKFTLDPLAIEGTFQVTVLAGE